MILVQSVLSSIPVYWMGLAPLPASIIQSLRRVMFNFLWGSSNTNRKYHLVKWMDLSWPKEFGGWGIKNLSWFSMALRINTFWRVLQSGGLWYQVLFVKYIKKGSITDWLRSKKFYRRNISVIWRGFIHILPWIGSNLAWQVGKGTEILVGVDPIAGTYSGFYLPEDLRSYLQDMDIVFLVQAHNSEPDALGYWYTAEDLNLGGHFYELWNDYTAGLISAGIRLVESDDELIWDYRKKKGSISARNAYDCIVSSSRGSILSPIDKFL